MAATSLAIWLLDSDVQLSSMSSTAFCNWVCVATLVPSRLLRFAACEFAVDEVPGVDEDELSGDDEGGDELFGGGGLRLCLLKCT